MKNVSPLFLADWYKPSHIDQYNPKSEVIFSNFTPRGTDLYVHFLDEDKRILNWGIQGAIKQYLVEYWKENFFDLNIEDIIEDYVQIKQLSIGEKTTRTDHIRALHKYGKLPLVVRALPEGSLSPAQVPVYTVHNLRPDVMQKEFFYWLVNQLECLFSNETWKKFTNATTVFQYRKLCEQFAAKTCDSNAHVQFQGHDFSLRGFTGMEDGYSNGTAHLSCFSGTDNIPSIIYVNNYYGMKGKFSAGSIPASEHSVATTNIGFIVGRLKTENPEMSKDDLRFYAEVEFLDRYITEIYPTGTVSYVADSYDYQRLIREGLTILKDKITSRDGTLVIRPDSGDPVKVVAGYNFIDFEEAKAIIQEQYTSGKLGWPSVLESNLEEVDSIKNPLHFTQSDCKLLVGLNYELIKHDGKYFDVATYSTLNLSEDEVKGSIEVLWEVFGGSVNKKGFKVLDSHIGLIYGDSITLKRAKEIFELLEKKGFASSNIVYGIGSYTYQYNTRDSLGFAFKATGSIIDGQEIQVSKEPKTDMKKRSAFGFLKVIKNSDGEYEKVDGLGLEEIGSPDNELRIIFNDGKLVVDEDLITIRERINSYFKS